MSRLRALYREPLVHFLLIGVLLFVAYDTGQQETDAAPDRILVDGGKIEQLAAQFERSRLRPPTEAELLGLIEGEVRDEVYYREARAMGLDQNDPVVRQRMRLKLEFLLEDMASEATPNDTQLSEFMQRHAARFRQQPRLSFTQVYLDPAQRPNLEVDAAAILERLNAGAAAMSEGDRTLLGAQYKLVAEYEISRIFGEDFANQIVALEPGAWTGPLSSGYGAHLVRVTEKQAGRLPELSEVRRQVEQAYLVEQRRELKETTYRKLRDGYEIVIEGGLLPDAVTAKSGADANPSAQ